ncbi:PAS domain S-box protein [Hymenobacter sp. B81]|uniref:PAS domain S-box protein n=1 Tax=Hymenobacter sp. B81 TaxID=3344878 RepID=UPI0037DCE94A
MPSADPVGAGAAFEHSPAALFVLDPGGYFVRINARFAQLTGYADWQLAGRGPWHFVPAAAAVGLRQALTAAGTVAGAEADWLTAAGSRRPLWLTLLPARAGEERYGVAQDRSPAALAERVVWQREQQLSAIFNSIADVTFVLDVEPVGRYRFAFINRAFELTTGLPEDKVLGQYVEDVIPEPSLSLVLTQYRQAIETRQRVSWLETWHYPTGQVMGEVGITPVFDEDGRCRQLVGIVHDLTEQSRAAEALLLSNERFRYAIRATSDAIYDWNIPADSLYWGEGLETLFGYSLTENPKALDQWSDAVHPDDAPRITDGLNALLADPQAQKWQEEYRFRRADGSWATVADHGYILRNPQGEAQRMIGAMQDISAHKEAEEKQRQMAQELFEQNADLQQFTYIISHNLRAPLANAHGYADLLTRVSKDSDVFDTSLQHLRTSLRQLDAVLTDITTILSIRDKQQLRPPEPVHLAGVCQQVTQLLAESLHACGGTVQCGLARELRVNGNRAYFHSIFYNLVSNAIKYRSPERPLRVAITGQAQAGGGVVVQVQDNGLGFDYARVGEGVFELYKRFHPDQPGRGLGLFLVKSHVESMGGRIAVSSAVNQGACFTLHFS